MAGWRWHPPSAPSTRNHGPAPPVSLRCSNFAVDFPLFTPSQPLLPGVTITVYDLLRSRRHQPVHVVTSAHAAAESRAAHRRQRARRAARPAEGRAAEPAVTVHSAGCAPACRRRLPRWNSRRRCSHAVWGPAVHCAVTASVPAARAAKRVEGRCGGVGTARGAGVPPTGEAPSGEAALVGLSPSV